MCVKTSGGEHTGSLVEIHYYWNLTLGDERDERTQVSNAAYLMSIHLENIMIARGGFSVCAVVDTILVRKRPIIKVPALWLTHDCFFLCSVSVSRRNNVCVKTNAGMSTTNLILCISKLSNLKHLRFPRLLDELIAYLNVAGQMNNYTPVSFVYRFERK